MLTKTMINNYAKNRLLPPPVKKKYSKEHLLVLIFIYYFKDFLSFNDIQSILTPLTERYFQSDTDFNMEWIYKEVYRLGKEELSVLKEDVSRMYQVACRAFPDGPDEDEDFLQIFSMICLLSFDVYMKKQLIEKLIDKCSAEKWPKKRIKKNKAASAACFLFWRFWDSPVTFRFLYAHSGENHLIAVISVNQGTVYPADGGGGSAGSLRDFLIRLLFHQHSGHFKALGKGQQFIYRAHIFEKFIAFFSVLQAEYRVKQFIHRICSDFLAHVCSPCVMDHSISSVF